MAIECLNGSSRMAKPVAPKGRKHGQKGLGLNGQAPKWLGPKQPVTKHTNES